ncbi:MAG TPA: HDOD domain-containing protein [Polyangiaceae bacterium]|nr:HDOD domain-containing protein [Polyangiaceae bacterium]
MRLLFVDDEPSLLRALQQSLRGQRKIWEMDFVDGATAALEKLELQPYDAVISDIRMPFIDGAELLKRVRLARPDTLRIVLSGQMDDRAAARAAASAHRFLAKPCETHVLVATLTRALELRAQLQSDRMRSCIGGIATLPSLPSHCAALNYALEKKDVTLGQIAEIVGNDIGMATKLLQLANSSFFGLPRSVASIEQAIIYLGLSAVRSLVVAHALSAEPASADTARLEAVQQRSLMVAGYARRFRLEPRQAEAAATAALLHNVGELALMACMPGEHDANQAYAREHGMSTADAESARLGVTSAELGAYLLALWGLPFEVVEAVGSQDAPLETWQALDAGAVVWLARGLATEALGASAGAQRLADEVVARLGAAEVVASLRQEIAEPAVARRAS